jgi:hypothetical protein
MFVHVLVSITRGSENTIASHAFRLLAFMYGKDTPPYFGLWFFLDNHGFAFTFNTGLYAHLGKLWILLLLTFRVHPNRVSHFDTVMGM